MATKIIVRMPRALAAEAGRIARHLRKSRSQLYRAAVAEYVVRHDPEEITRALDRVADRIDTRQDDFVRAAALRALR